jgi:arylsulfate sulfotransferase
MLETPARLALFFAAAGLFFLPARAAQADEADDVTITIGATNPGPTALIKQLTLTASQTDVLKAVQFEVTPKPGSVTRALSATFSHDYLIEHSYLDPATGKIFLPIWGLYKGYSNVVTLTYSFQDGSSKQESKVIPTAGLTDDCGEFRATKVQPRLHTTSLSYDYFFMRGICNDSPVIIDTDGEVRWVSPFPSVPKVKESSSNFFDNAVYVTRGSVLNRVDLDGTVTPVADYASLGIIEFHHDIDPGKNGMILDATTNAYVESVNIEVDAAGNVLKMWNIADIISEAMIAGGDDPSGFVYPAPNDWFHNNSVAYRRSDNSLFLSSRENFVICLDYDSLKIKWILGDKAKHWYQYPSLANFALTLAPGGVPPIGQHAVSVTVDNNLFLMDNGRYSGFQQPPGINLNMSLPRKYAIDQAQGSATEVMDYPGSEKVYSLFCGSAYEDAKQNILTDYAAVAGNARLLGFDGTGAKVFEYSYPTVGCTIAYNSFPLHLESTKFPAVGPQALNLSTRADVKTGDQALIGGFIVTGKVPKLVVLRALGPSLTAGGVSGALADPTLYVSDSSGKLVAANDNWQTDPGADTLTGNHLAPTDPLEAAAALTLRPGAYTVVVNGSNAGTGVGLVEAYDLSPSADSRLANISSRARVGTGDDVLISGFIIGDIGKTTVVARALGPSLSASDVHAPLSDPTLTVYDGNGLLVGSNDNWKDDPNAGDVAANDLAPTESAESAILLNLPAGAYTAVVRGVAESTGVGLVEVYNLH